MLDIGCNYGSHTLGMCKELQRRKSSGKIYCFEIQPRMLNLLQQNINQNGCADKVVVCPFGLGNKNEIRTFNLPKNYNTHPNPGALSLKSNNIEHHEDVKVPIMRLDDLKISNISLIKIDVEGFELEALEGGYQTIMKNRPIIVIEMWEKYKDKYIEWINKNFPFYHIEHISVDDYILIPHNKNS